MHILGIPLEKEMATHSNILAWAIPWTEETGRLQSMGSQSDMTVRLSMRALGIPRVSATVVMNIVNYVILGKLLNLFEILL